MQMKRRLSYSKRWIVKSRIWYLNMNQTLIKLLRVYITGDANLNIMDKGARRIAEHPESGSFEEYLREQYHNEYYRDSLSDFPLDTYEDEAKRYPGDSIMHFNLAQACIVWCEELEKDYLKSLSECMKADPEYSIDEKEVMNGRVTTFRDYYSMRSTAVDCLNQIIKLEPDLPLDIVAYLIKAIYDLYRVKDWEWTLKARGSGLHFLRGGEYEQDGKIDAAIKECLRAIQLAPDHGSAHEQLGHIYKARGMFKEAAFHYKEIIRYYPHFPAGHYFLGDLYKERGKYDEAAQEYMEIIKLAPKQADAFFRLASVLEELGRYKDSLIHWRNYLSLSPNQNSEQQGKDLALKHIEFLERELRVG